MELLAVKWTMLNYSFKTEARLLSVQHWSCIYIHWHQTKRHQLLERRWLKPFIMFCLNNTSAAEWLWVSLPVWSVCRGSRGWFLFFCFFFFFPQVRVICLQRHMSRSSREEARWSRWSAERPLIDVLAARPHHPAPCFVYSQRQMCWLQSVVEY